MMRAFRQHNTSKLAIPQKTARMRWASDHQKNKYRVDDSTCKLSTPGQTILPEEFPSIITSVLLRSSLIRHRQRREAPSPRLNAPQRQSSPILTCHRQVPDEVASFNPDVNYVSYHEEIGIEQASFVPRKSGIVPCVRGSGHSRSRAIHAGRREHWRCETFCI